MKENFEEVQVEVIKFDAEDVITASITMPYQPIDP